MSSFDDENMTCLSRDDQNFVLSHVSHRAKCPDWQPLMVQLAEQFEAGETGPLAEYVATPFVRWSGMTTEEYLGQFDHDPMMEFLGRVVSVIRGCVPAEADECDEDPLPCAE